MPIAPQESQLLRCVVAIWRNVLAQGRVETPLSNLFLTLWQIAHGSPKVRMAEAKIEAQITPA